MKAPHIVMGLLAAHLLPVGARAGDYAAVVASDRPSVQLSLDKPLAGSEKIAGIVAGGAGLTGKAAAVSHSEIPSLDGDFTIEFWAKAALAQPSRYPSLFEFGRSDVGGGRVWMEPGSGHLHFKRFGRTPATTQRLSAPRQRPRP